jgi:hypothetical protein
VTSGGETGGQAVQELELPGQAGLASTPTYVALGVARSRRWIGNYDEEEWKQRDNEIQQMNGLVIGCYSCIICQSMMFFLSVLRILH